MTKVTETGTSIPTSETLLKCAEDMKAYGDGLTKLGDSVKMLMGSLKTFQKIDPKAVKDGGQALVSMSRSIKTITNGLSDIITETMKLNDSLKNSKDTDKIIKALIGEDQGEVQLNPIEEFDKNGNIKKRIPQRVPKQAGLLTVVGKIMEVSAQMSKMEAPNPSKFKKTFDKTMELFKHVTSSMQEIAAKVDESTMTSLNNSVVSLGEIMLTFPKAIETYTNLLAKIGNPRTKILARSGLGLLVGQKGKQGILPELRTINVVMKKVGLDDAGKWKTYEKSLDTFSKTIRNIDRSLVLAGITAPIAWAAAVVWFGVGGRSGKLSILGMIIGAMDRLSQSNKDVKEAGKTISRIALAVMLFSAAMALIALTGVLIVKGWKFFLVALGALVVLCTLFSLLGSKMFQREINQGTKEILIMSAAIAILALTAVLIGALGRFIKMSWKQFLLFFGLMVMLVGAFMALSFASQWINSGAREVLAIAGAVAILALTAVLIGLVGRFMVMNWEGFGVFAIYMVVLVGVFVILALASGFIQSGATEALKMAGAVAILAGTALLIAFLAPYLEADWMGFLYFAAFIAIMVAAFIGVGFAASLVDQGVGPIYAMAVAMVVVAGVMLALSYVVNNTDMDKLWIGFGLMCAILVAFGVVAVGLAWVAGFITAGVAAMIVLMVPLVMLATSILMIAIAIKTIMDATKDMDSDGIKASLEMPFTCLGGVIDMINDFGLISLMKAVAKMVSLSAIVSCIGNMCETLQMVASLKMPVEFDKDGKVKTWRLMETEDFEKAAMSVGAVASFFINIFDTDGPGVLDKDGNVVAAAIDLNAADNLSFWVVKKIERLGVIVGVIGDMCTVISNVANLLVPDTTNDGWLNAEGKIVKWRPMEKEDFKKAARNSSVVMEYFIDLFQDGVRDSSGSIVYPGINFDALDNLSHWVMKRIERLNGVVGVIGGMMDVIHNVANMLVPDSSATGWYDEKTGKIIKWKPMIDTDFITAAVNIETLMSFMLDEITTTCKGLDDRVDEDDFEMAATVMGCISPLQDVIKIIQTLASGIIPVYGAGVDENGKPVITGYININRYLNKNKIQVQNTITTMFTTLVNALAFKDANGKELANSPLKNIKDASKNAEQLAEPIKSMTGMINNVIQLYNNGLEKLDANQFSTQWSGLITGITAPIFDFDAAKVKASGAGINMIDKIIKVYKDFPSNNEAANVLAKQVDSTIKLMNKINSVNTDKLKHAAKTMESLAKFSASIKGNFDKLSKCISNDILKALENLTKELERIKDIQSNINISTSSGGLRSSAEALANAWADEQRKNGNNPTDKEISDQHAKYQADLDAGDAANAKAIQHALEGFFEKYNSTDNQGVCSIRVHDD